MLLFIFMKISVDGVIVQNDKSLIIQKRPKKISPNFSPKHDYNLNKLLVDS